MTCLQCGKQFDGERKRKYCSHECAIAASTKKGNFPCPNCGKPMFRKQFKRDRKCMSCTRTIHGMHLKAIGVNPYVFETDESKSRRLASLRTEQHRKRVSIQWLDKPKTSPLQKKFSPRHSRAIECFFRDPKNVIHYCCNISKFVNENRHLFADDDIIQKRPSKSYLCNATKGLAALHRGDVLTWKGWMFVSNREGRERFDLIARNSESNHAMEAFPAGCPSAD